MHRSASHYQGPPFCIYPTRTDITHTHTHTRHLDTTVARESKRESKTRNPPKGPPLLHDTRERLPILCARQMRFCVRACDYMPISVCTLYDIYAQTGDGESQSTALWYMYMYVDARGQAVHTYTLCTPIFRIFVQ